MQELNVTLTFQNTEPQDIAALIQLTQRFLGASWNEAFVTWKYVQNPSGHVYSRCAKLDGQAVGFYGNIPLRLKMGDKIVTGSQAVDGVVVPEVRRQGLFVKLAQQTYQQMDQAGVALTYAFPNSTSQSAFLNRLAWAVVGEIPRYVWLLDVGALSKVSGRKGPKAWSYRLALETIRLTTPRYVPNLKSDVRVREAKLFDTRFGLLWQRVAGAFPIAVIRDEGYLMWRYVHNPLGRYMILTAERGEDLVGYSVLSLRDANGVAALTELIVSAGDEQAGLILLDEVAVVAQRLGCTQIQCWMLPHHTFYINLLKQSGFVFYPSGYMPGLLRYTTPFIIRLRPAITLSLDPMNLQNWFITMGDHDYY